MPSDLAADAPIRKVEFIDPHDPEWKDFLHLIKETKFDGGLLREDTENGNITIIFGINSINLLAEQRGPLKSALLATAKDFPEASDVDLGHITTIGTGYSIVRGKPKVTHIQVSGIGDLILTPEQAATVAEAL